MGRKNLNRKTAEEVLHFLDYHLLDPTPANYSFGYLYVTGANGWLHRTVDAMTDGGVRLTQIDVNELMDQAPSEASRAANFNAAIDEHQTHLRHQVLSFVDLTEQVAQNTGDFSRDLEESVCQIGGHEELGGVIKAMLKRTNNMELKLAETRRETERLRQDLDAARDDAMRDALTKLPNRRAIDLQLAAIAEAGQPLSIAFCDIDHFKAINDRYGHAVGDRVLRVVADTLSEALAPHVVGRFGGEEFVVLLPETDESTAFELVEKARLALCQRHFKVRDTDEPIGQVTFSAGIAMTSGDPLRALRDADTHLYEAKRTGRNRTVWKLEAAAA